MIDENRIREIFPNGIMEMTQNLEVVRGGQAMAVIPIIRDRITEILALSGGGVTLIFSKLNFCQ